MPRIWYNALSLSTSRLSEYHYVAFLADFEYLHRLQGETVEAEVHLESSNVDNAGFCRLGLDSVCDLVINRGVVPPRVAIFRQGTVSHDNLDSCDCEIRRLFFWKLVDTTLPVC